MTTSSNWKKKESKTTKDTKNCTSHSKERDQISLPKETQRVKEIHLLFRRKKKEKEAKLKKTTGVKEASGTSFRRGNASRVKVMMMKVLSRTAAAAAARRR